MARSGVRSPFGHKANSILALAGLCIGLFVATWVKLAASGDSDGWLPAIIYSVIAFLLVGAALIYKWRNG